MRQTAFATKISSKIKKDLDYICETLGLKKSHIIEEALREKIEDLSDAHDLKMSMDEATGFHDWETVKKEFRKRSKN